MAYIHKCRGRINPQSDLENSEPEKAPILLKDDGLKQDMKIILSLSKKQRWISEPR